MSITINAKGTTVPYFKIGKTGVTFYQGTADPSLSYTMVDGDYWFDQDLNKLSVWLSSAWTAPRLADITFVNNEIAAFGGGDLVLRADGVNSRVVIQGDTGPAIITTASSQDLYIDPSLGGGGDLILIDNKWPAADGTNGQALITDGAGNLVFTTLTGTGTVTTASVVSANGFAGSVATASTTPAITLTTTVTGVLKGNGTAISAATSGTDYSAGTSALATGILKSTTGTGALSIAVAGDFPTLNQDTTGNAATATTATNTVISNDNSTGATVYPTWVTATTGNLPQNTSSTKLSFVPSSGILTATGFAGSGAAITNIPNSALTNSSITIGSTNVALGATQTAFTGLTTISMSGQLTSTLTTGSPPFVVTSTTPVANLSIGGNAGSATQLITARNITATGDASWMVSFNGTTDVSSSLTLVTVNSSPQTNTFRKVTVNGKGLVTATSPVSFDDITTALGYTPVDIAGDTMTGALVLPLGTVSLPSLTFTGDLNTGIWSPGADTIGFSTAGVRRATIDGDGSFILGSNGTATPTAVNPGGNILDIVGSETLVRVLDDANGAYIEFVKSRAGAIVANADNLGRVYFEGFDGANMLRAASVEAFVDGTPGTNDMPGRLGFFTTADGASSSTERFRISSTGAWGISGANYGTTGQVLQSNSSTGAPTWSSTPTLTAINVSDVGLIDSATLTTSAVTAGQVVDSFAIATYRAASYQISITSGSAYMYTEIKVMHDGTNTYMTETNTMLSGASLATFTTDISGGNLRLLTTPANAVTSYKALATMIVV